MTSSRSAHWDRTYTGRVSDTLSWFEAEPRVSLELVEAVGTSPSDPVVDVGGGESHLVDALLSRGFTDVTVLDVSAVALDAAAERVGPGTRVEWVVSDVLEWRPRRSYGLWHDRAAFHFLVDPVERDAYLRTMEVATAGGAVILATFAADGPEYCSGLPVARYSAEDLTDLLEGFDVIEARRVVHVTPTGAEQPFTYVAARSRGRTEII